MYIDIVNILTVVVTQLFLGMFTFLLIDFKQPTKLFKRRWIMTIAGVVLANVGIIVFYGYWEVYIKIAIVTMTLPYIIVTMIVSRQKGAKVLFNLATCIFIGCIGNLMANIALYFFPQFPLVKVIARFISFVLLYFLLKKIREPYKNMLTILKQGWTVLCLIPLTTFFTMVFITNTFIKTQPIVAMIAMIGLTLICGFAYVLIYLFFEQVYQDCEVKAEKDLLVTQVNSLTGQVYVIQSIEEKIRIERHDLRHRLQIITALLEKGNVKAALDYLGASKKILDELQPTHWCNNPILDAILSSYLAQCETAHIQIDASLDIPNDLPVDATELSIVFANALENAMNACAMLPIEQRRISFKCISHPQLMIEISNPYVGEIIMDDKGIPISKKKDHGIGTRSIVAFVKKYNAMYDFEAKNDLFSLRITL